MADAFNAPGVAKPSGVFSNAAWQPPGRVLHIAGAVSQDADGRPVAAGDMAGQTRQVLENIRAVLAAAGGTLDDVASVTVYVTDLKDLAAIQTVRREMLKPPYPASTLVKVAALAKPEYLIEISAVAVIPDSRARRPA